MAKLDKKDKSAYSGEKHSLSSFEKKKGEKIVFNVQTRKKYRSAYVQRKNGDNSIACHVSHNDKSVSAAENAKPVNNKTDNKQVYQRTVSYTPDAVHNTESKSQGSEKAITPEIAQRMKRAAYLQEQNNANIQISTARTDFPENTADRYSDSVSDNDTGIDNVEKKVLEHKYVSQTSDSVIPEQSKAITPEMALRMKRAAFLSQKNEEAIRLNRAVVVSDEDNLEANTDKYEEYSEETSDVPVEHLEENENNAYESSYLGNSEHAVFNTYDNDVRAYRSKAAYGEYIKNKHSRSRINVQFDDEPEKCDDEKGISDAIVGRVAEKSVQSAVNGAETVSQAVLKSDSVGNTVLDVSAVLAAIEAKKMVKKLAETELKKKERVEERIKNHGNRFGIDKYDEVTGKNEKSQNYGDEADKEYETSCGKQGSTKVGNSNKLQQEKQEYNKKQRAKEVKDKQKEIFIKENKKTSGNIYSSALGKAEVFRRIVSKKGGSAVIGGGAAAVIMPLISVVLIFILILAFFGWLSPFSYGLAGEDPDTEHNAETKAEVIDGYVLMIKNYMDVTQAYYYLNYGDWYGGVYQYESADLDFGTFFSAYCQNIVAEIQAQYQSLINQAASPAQAMAISQAMGQAISQALANAQAAAIEEYTRLIEELNDEFTPTEHRQHYEVEVTGGINGVDDSAEFYGRPIPGTNNFGNTEINSDLSAEELLAYVALYKSLLTINSDDADADPDAEDEEETVNITSQDIMDFFEKTEYISITAEVTHNNPCAGQNCKRRLVGDVESGYSWQYYCDSDHDNLSGAIGSCLTADELIAKIMELTNSEDIGVDEESCKKIIESYLDMFKEELDIDESGFRLFGAADNTKAQEFYRKLISDGEIPNNFWEVNTPIDGEESND